jgi:cation:H+ antiporter
LNPLVQLLDEAGLGDPVVYAALFLLASLLMMWRLEALLSHGLEGTALGTVITPFCSGLANLVFVFVVRSHHQPSGEILTNALVNNGTNLTLLIGLPAILWGLPLEKPAKAGRSKGNRAQDVAGAVSRLSLGLSLSAALFFTATTWILSEDGSLSTADGLILCGMFAFWQTFQVFDVLKHNVRQQRTFGPLFALDLLAVMLAAAVLYTSIDQLVAWISTQDGPWISARNLGWLSGCLMVVPNGLMAFLYAARRRADIAYSSQVGDGHICIPLCIGLGALLGPLPVPDGFRSGLVVIAATVCFHLVSVIAFKGIPREVGWILLAGYAVFLIAA